MRIQLERNKYVVYVIIFSLFVSILIHFPEILMLSDNIKGTHRILGMRWGEVISEIFFTFISLLILYCVNYYIIFKNNIIKKNNWTILLFALIVTWTLNGMISKTFVFIHKNWNIPAITATIHYYLHPLRDFVISLIVSGSSYMFYIIKKHEQTMIENQELKGENLINQFEALKNQLNPHMLFNSLNALKSLIREAPDKAQNYLQELSRVLRYMLQGADDKCVSISEEMSFVKSYIFLLKMRYEDNLIFEIIGEDTFLNKKIPPMAIQLLIENAVKHNEISSRKPLAISINIEEDRVVIENKLQPKITENPGTGIGLVNLAERYRLIFNEEIKINKSDNKFRVCLPLMD